jgi:hypothetical protein
MGLMVGCCNHGINNCTVHGVMLYTNSMAFMGG